MFVATSLDGPRILVTIIPEFRINHHLDGKGWVADAARFTKRLARARIPDALLTNPGITNPTVIFMQSAHKSFCTIAPERAAPLVDIDWPSSNAAEIERVAFERDRIRAATAASQRGIIPDARILGHRAFGASFAFFSVHFSANPVVWIRWLFTRVFDVAAGGALLPRKEATGLIAGGFRFEGWS